jgi:hypothetical protein
MKIEAFSEGKNLDAPEANEDQFLVLPGRGYAVIDGATDITGHLYDGKRGGWLASHIAMQAVADFLLDSAEREPCPERLIAHVSAAIRASYVRHNILDIARCDPARRSGDPNAGGRSGETFRFVLIATADCDHGVEAWSTTPSSTGDGELMRRPTESWAKLAAEWRSVRVPAARAPSGRGEASSRHAALAGRDEAPAAVRTQSRLVPRALSRGSLRRYPTSARLGHRRAGAIRE